MSKTDECISLENEYGAKNYNPLDVVLTKGKGIWVEDVEGNKYMDFLAAYSALNQGHNHPRLVKALKEQAEKLSLTSRAFRNDQLPYFEKELCEMTGYEMMLPMNSGAEAVETAIKAARKWGEKVKGVEKNKSEIIVCEGNFHGRTTTIISFSSEPQYREGFGPYTPGFEIIEYNDPKALEEAINEKTVAFMVEPIQGESGVVLPDEGYMSEVEQICEDNNVLLITDEIQSGLGRTGKMFATDHEDVKPDMITIGKALSGGMYPISAVVSSKEVLGVFNPGDHGSTFGGNPIASAVARESLKVLQEENMFEKSAENGKYFMDKLESIDSPYIEKIRGKGLWIGIVLDRDARPFCKELKDKGILAKDTHGNVIRIAPPLVITKDEIDQAFEKIEDVLTN